MSNSTCPECLKYRKGEFCQACYIAKKKEIVELKAQHQRSAELALEAHKESLRTVFDQIEEVRSSTSYMDLPFKLKDLLNRMRNAVK